MGIRTDYVEFNMDNPIFLVGLPRSGSTFWLNLITLNPKIFKIGEMFFLSPPWRKDFRYFLRTSVGDLSKENNIRKMINLMFSGQKIPGISASFWQYYVKSYDEELKERVFKRICESEKSLQSIFKAIIEEIPGYFGFDRCCVKFPVFVNYVPNLWEWYPNSKVIHIIRDPRAVAISRANFRGERKFKNRKMMILFTALQYVWTSRLHCKYNEHENYALFRYEDLLAEPKDTIRKICDFAELDFVPEMLEPKEGQASSVTGEKATGFNKITASHWKQVITPLEKKVITLLTASSMERFGYDPDHHPIYLEN